MGDLSQCPLSNERNAQRVWSDHPRCNAHKLIAIPLNYPRTGHIFANFKGQKKAMQRLLHVVQFIAPAVGLAGLTLIVIDLKVGSLDWGIAQQGVPFVLFGLLFRPRRGHPMADLLGMHRNREVTPVTTPEAEDPKAFLHKFIEQNATGLSHEPGVLPHHAQPVRLIPCLPGEAAPERSWIGGAPMLPTGMSWPEANGAPMLLVAQIALEDLPKDTWGACPAKRMAGLLYSVSGADRQRHSRASPHRPGR